MTYLKQVQKNLLTRIHAASLTTEDIAGKCENADYYILRCELAKLEDAGLIARSKESGWRWSLTTAGKDALVAEAR